MIKVNHLNKTEMDLVMGLSRELNETPENIIKNILSITNYNEAKRAINESKNKLSKGEENTCKNKE